MPPCALPSGHFFIPEASPLLCLMAFLILTFNTRGPYTPWTPSSGEFFFTYSEYFTISNCVFNFKILPLVVSEILVVPIFKLGGAVPPVRRLMGKFLYPRPVRCYV